MSTLQGRGAYLKDKIMTQQAGIRDRHVTEMTTVAKREVTHEDKQHRVPRIKASFCH